MMMHTVSRRKLIFIYLLLETRLDAFAAETRSDATCERVCLRSSTALRCSKCFILAAPKRASAMAFKTQFERSRNAFGTMKKPTWVSMDGTGLNMNLLYSWSSQALIPT